MKRFAIMILKPDEDPHPRYEFIATSENKFGALKKAILYMQSWEMKDAKITACREISVEEYTERTTNTLHYMAESWRNYKEEELQRG